jgi:hypothetical protein
MTLALLTAIALLNVVRAAVLRLTTWHLSKVVICHLAGDSRTEKLLSRDSPPGEGFCHAL